MTGTKTKVEIDASASYDPDVANPATDKKLLYFWLCRTDKEVFPPAASVDFQNVKGVLAFLIQLLKYKQKLLKI